MLSYTSRSQNTSRQYGELETPEAPTPFCFLLRPANTESAPPLPRPPQIPCNVYFRQHIHFLMSEHCQHADWVAFLDLCHCSSFREAWQGALVYLFLHVLSWLLTRLSGATSLYRDSCQIAEKPRIRSNGRGAMAVTFVPGEDNVWNGL